MNLLNPYELLGVSIQSTSRELKKSYYNLSLLCHPDKGGSAKDMDIVHKAYLYIKEQLLNNEKCITYEMAEEEFDAFCKNQEEHPPPFSKIYEDMNEFVRDFNIKFEKVHNATHNPFKEGYGDLMERRDIRSIDYTNICKYDCNLEKLKKPVKNIFSQEILDKE